MSKSGYVYQYAGAVNIKIIKMSDEYATSMGNLSYRPVYVLMCRNSK